MKELLTKLLLQSPLRLMMNNTMLISFKNRFNGVEQSLPLFYIQDEDTLTCFTDFDTDWWRNLTVDSKVQVRIKDRDVSGTARVITANDDRDAMVYQLTGVDHAITYEEAVQAAPYMVMVQVNLTS
jgi:hypothetical protein